MDEASREHWLVSAVAEDVGRRRLCLLACICCGLIQKPVIAFAHDVEILVDVVLDVFRRGCGASAVGCSALLCRQMFSEAGQHAVRDITRRPDFRTWTHPHLLALLSRMDALSPQLNGKRRGRMTQFTGSRWLRALLAKDDNLAVFHAVGVLLGSYICDVDPAIPAARPSAVAENPAAVAESYFARICSALQEARFKLPMIDKYSVPHIVRACTHVRRMAGNPVDSPCAVGWNNHLRVMHAERTDEQFTALQVVSYHDACLMLFSIRTCLKSWYGRSLRGAGHLSAMDLIDLPCQTCEFGAVLGAVRTFLRRGCGGPVEDAMVVSWLLSRLPRSRPAAVGMSKRLKHLAKKHEGYTTGLDAGCAGAVTARWLQACVGDTPALRPGEAAWVGFPLRGCGVLLGLPNLTCGASGEAFSAKDVQHHLRPRSGRGVPTECLRCTQASRFADMVDASGMMEVIDLD